MVESSPCQFFIAERDSEAAPAIDAFLFAELFLLMRGVLALCGRPHAPLKAQCCPAEPARKIHRSVHEDARDLARSLSKTKAYAQSSKDRKKVEMLFAHMKKILKVDRLRLRGMSGAHDEFLLAATAQNLRRMAQWLGTDPPGALAGAIP